MVEMVKAIHGESCEVYSIIHHRRIPVGEAVPDVKIYQRKTYVEIKNGHGIHYKSMYFSIVICPDPGMDRNMTEEKLDSLTSFELALKLPNKDGVAVDFGLCDVIDATIEPGRWEFTIQDKETVDRLLAL